MAGSFEYCFASNNVATEKFVLEILATTGVRNTVNFQRVDIGPCDVVSSDIDLSTSTGMVGDILCYYFLEIMLLQMLLLSSGLTLKAVYQRPFACFWIEFSVLVLTKALTCSAAS